jgi:hypothetical protein
MGLLDGGMAGVFGGIMSGFYPAATLHRAIITHDGEGGGSTAWAAGEDCRAQLDRTIERTVDGNVETLQSILLLQQFNDGAGALQTTVRPSTDDEISAGGSRWQIATIETDPAGAYFLLGGRASAVASS